MIKEFEGILPDIDEKAYIAEGGHIIGAVKIKEFSSIWHNTVVRASNWFGSKQKHWYYKLG